MTQTGVSLLRMWCHWEQGMQFCPFFVLISLYTLLTSAFSLFLSFVVVYLRALLSHFDIGYSLALVAFFFFGCSGHFFLWPSHRCGKNKLWLYEKSPLFSVFPLDFWSRASIISMSNTTMGHVAALMSGWWLESVYQLCWQCVGFCLH